MFGKLKDWPRIAISSVASYGALLKRSDRDPLPDPALCDARRDPNTGSREAHGDDCAQRCARRCIFAIMSSPPH